MLCRSGGSSTDGMRWGPKFWVPPWPPPSPICRSSTQTPDFPYPFRDCSMNTSTWHHPFRKGRLLRPEANPTKIKIQVRRGESNPAPVSACTIVFRVYWLWCIEQMWARVRVGGGMVVGRTCRKRGGCCQASISASAKREKALQLKAINRTSWSYGMQSSVKQGVMRQNVRTLDGRNIYRKVSVLWSDFFLTFLLLSAFWTMDGIQSANPTQPNQS